ncbi:DNA-directed RNA polymerase III subunit RPC6 [Gaeumannomyces tritici R3-111a-1]|uniref:DNA-directed RNA polymerase III subunit RPC6 n=1 Tax=Gaeumannomyces tritici (strain R3-111a-1) TaxID=644352 RepID=J3NQT6_GAET3|nr:DNA-directed RNA polymerase III subunit RPC6 [Gaeumannomyces tritici R3-111a-1]EJT78542.1 DNA-directed RNA polymerase III subunit RPC6 [Gaeumannomyces tritici R3-111a-1]
MATARSTPSMAEDPARIQELKEELYEACVNNGSIGRLYTQKDLFALDVVPEDSPMLLMRVVQGLTDDKLLVPVNDQRKGLCWKYRTREDAQKYINLPSSDAVLVYSIIDEAGADGIWSRAVLRRLGMHDATLKQALKQLESKGFISEMKSVEHPNKKMYIKANLKPSEKATGGPWYNDSTLDEAFIDELERVVFDIVKTQSTYKSHVNGTAAATGARAPKKAIKGSADQAKKGKKRSAVEAGVDGGEKPRVNGHAAATAEAAAVAAARKNVLRPLPAGYKGYPTTKQIAVLIGKAGIAKNQTLAEDDIQQLVDVLVFDGLIEPVHHGYEPRKPGYRATAIPRLDDAATSDSNQLDVVRMGPPARENGLTEAPCGNCPVFELCEEGGPVSPRTCIYYNRWLGLEEEKKPEVVEL